MNWLSDEDLCSYEESRKLSEETSKSDPENEPFRSKYKAREFLQELKNKIEHSIEDQPSEDLVLLSCCLQYHLGVNYVETEEISSGEEHLLRCNERLVEHRSDHRCVAVAVAALNQLGIVWCQRSETQKSLEFLKVCNFSSNGTRLQCHICRLDEEAERIYKDFVNNVDTVPWGVHELFLKESSHKSDHERTISLESIHTLTLYYLAQVYGMLDEKIKSAQLCHITLKRQLESKQYSAMDWALNSATLSQFYIAEDNYPSLDIVSEVLLKHPEALEVTGDEVDGDIEEIQHRKADIARCWLKYCIALLTFSGEKQSNPFEVTEDNNRAEAENAEEGGESYKIPEKFETLELGTWEDKVPDIKVTNFEEARRLFLAGQEYVSESKCYYVFDGHVSDYIEIVQDHSQLFKLLSQFELDYDRRCKMQKRRIDMLAEILDELNPQFFLHVCRQIIFEIAETYNTMGDLKLEIKQRAGGTPTAHVIKKINSLITKSIEYFQRFVGDGISDPTGRSCEYQNTQVVTFLTHLQAGDTKLYSLRDPQGVMPDEYEENLVRPTLVAHFYIGRLYGNLISTDVATRIKWLESGAEHYKALADYCHKYPSASKLVENELEICEDMVQFAPIRIDGLKRGVMT